MLRSLRGREGPHPYREQRVKHLRHPEATAENARARLDAHNAAIRERLKTPGFGYVVLLYTAAGARRAEHARTYGEAVDLRNREMASGLYEKSWLIQKIWDASMSITRDDPRDRAERYSRWIRERDEEDL